MKITSITGQKKNVDRVNVLVDGRYRFSLDIYQVIELGIRVGNEYTEEELNQLETESQFGKAYSRSLEYCLMRPHSAKEVRDYLYRKTRPTRTKEGVMKDGISSETATRVFDRLSDKGYIDDDKFAHYWVENRSLTRGASRRKIQMELQAKGVSRDIIESQFGTSERQDAGEIQKVISKKQSRYPDEQKMIAYLLRQGFRYDDIKAALSPAAGNSDYSD